MSYSVLASTSVRLQSPPLLTLQSSLVTQPFLFVLLPFLERDGPRFGGEEPKLCPSVWRRVLPAQLLICLLHWLQFSIIMSGEEMCAEINIAPGPVGVRQGFCVFVCVMYDGVCQKFTSARLTGCVKMLLSQISDGFIAKSSDTTTIYPGSQIYSDKKKQYPKCTIRSRNADQVKRYYDAMLLYSCKIWA